MKCERSLLSDIPALAATVRRFALGGGVAVALAASPQLAAAQGDPVAGARTFRSCMACHSIDPGQNMTGPSLAGAWGRKAAGVESFHRYSDALKRADIVWNDESLDAWLRNPAALVPGNEMRFPGIPDAVARNNVVAYLKAVAEGRGRAVAAQAGINMRGGLPDLKQAAAEVRVGAIRYCNDSYAVSTAGGRTIQFWEFNLRFKTDSSSNGPRKNEPVLVGQGMQGDRAQVVFANPAEIAAFIKSECPK